MKVGFNFAAIAATISVSAISLLPTVAMAVPPIAWGSGGMGFPPRSCSEKVMKVMGQMGLNPTQKDDYVQGFTNRTGVVVYCHPATFDMGSCGAGSSVVTYFVGSEDNGERSHMSSILWSRLIGARPACL